MSIKGGFFNAVNGDRTYNAADMCCIYSGIVSDGVFEDLGGGLEVSANDNMTVTVATGKAILNSKWGRNTEPDVLQITASNSSKPRIDSVVLKCDNSQDVRSFDLYVKAGTPAASPIAPSLANSDDIKEIALANIYVGANVSAIYAANITDTREFTRLILANSGGTSTGAYYSTSALYKTSSDSIWTNAAASTNYIAEAKGNGILAVNGMITSSNGSMVSTGDIIYNWAVALPDDLTDYVDNILNGSTTAIGTMTANPAQTSLMMCGCHLLASGLKRYIVMNVKNNGSSNLYLGSVGFSMYFAKNYTRV